VRIIGVQTESYPSLQASFKAGKPVWIDPKPTICDGVAVPFVADQMYPLLEKIVDEVVTVSEERVMAAIKQLMLESRLVVEGAGALSIAAALEIPPEKRGKTVCIVTGGSIGQEALTAILSET
jgi:threonine dehydratase